MALIDRACAFYDEMEYKFVDVPMLPVKRRLSDPYAQCSEAFIAAKTLRNEIPKGKYAVRSAIFGGGEQFIELFRTDDVDHWAIDEMIMDFSEFCRRELRKASDWRLERVAVATTYTKDAADLDLNGFRVATYGIRELEGLNLAFGTGLSVHHWLAACHATIPATSLLEE